jgi:phage shock protein C
MDRLYRSVDDRILAGVAGGMADMWDLDPSLVRLGWVVLTPLTAGFTILVYVVLALVVPEEPMPGVGMTGTPGNPAPTPLPPTPPPGPGVEPGPPPGSEALNEPSGGSPLGPQPYMRYSPGSDSWRDQRRAEKLQRRQARAEWRAQRHAARGGGPDSGAIVGGVILVLIGAAALASQVLPGFDWGRIWPIGLVVIGALLIARSAWWSGPRT